MRQHYRPFKRAVTGAVCAVAAVLSLLVAMPGPAMAVAATAWRTDGYGPGNTGYNPIETAINTGTVNSLKYRWSITSPVVPDTCMEQSPPVVANNRLFLNDQGGFAAYNATTGAPLWRYRDPRPQEYSTYLLSVNGNQVFAATDFCRSVSDPDGKLRAFNATTGALLWEVDRDPPMRVMVVDKGIVAVSGEDFSSVPRVTAYRISDGSIAWERPGGMFRPVSANGRLLIQKYDPENEVWEGSELVDITTGGVLWSSTVSWLVMASGPAGGPLYATNTAGDLVRINVETGAVVWTVPGGGVGAQLSTDGPRVYVAKNSQAVARDAETGAELWSRALSSPRPVGKPVVAGGVIYLTVSGISVDVRNAVTGAEIKSDQFPRAIGHPVVVNGRLYVTDGRVLDAFAP